MIIRIKNLNIDTIIGAYNIEKQAPQRIVVNARIEYDEGKASATDELGDTLNYHPICDKIVEMLTQKQYEILEAAVHDIGNFILAHPQVTTVEVEIDKPQAPIDGIESVSVSKIFTID